MAITRRDVYAVLVGPYRWDWISTRHVQQTGPVLLLCPLCRRVASVQRARKALLKANRAPMDWRLQEEARAAAGAVLPGLLREDSL